MADTYFKITPTADQITSALNIIIPRANASPPTILYTDDAQTITGAKDFSVAPTGPTPSNDAHLTTKAYVDGATALLTPKAIPVSSVNSSQPLALYTSYFITGTSSAINLTLPTGVAGGWIIVKCVSLSTGSINIDPGASMQIDSLTNTVKVPITTPNKSLTLVALNATTWYII